jgi:hypothetical protein
VSSPSALHPDDQRVVMLGIPLAVIALIAFFAGQAGAIAEHTSAVISLALAAVLLVLCGAQWLRGATMRKERIPVIAPLLLAGGPAARSLGILTSDGVGVAASIAFGLFAALIFGLALRKR